MAEELGEYLQGPYLDEKRDIERLRKTGSTVLDVFDRFFLAGEWPYQVMDGKEVSSPATFSFSTNAMIIFALAVATGRISHNALLPSLRQGPTLHRDKEQFDSLSAKMRQALARFPAEIDRCRNDSEHMEARDAMRGTGEELVTTSGSFGPNDPLTLTWLLELLGEGSPADPADRKALLAELVPVAKTVVKSTLNHPEHSPLHLRAQDLVPHAFPLLRVLHLSNTLSLHAGQRHPSPHVERAHDFLLNRVHLHLSASLIPDSGFDAGELVFSLEGVLLCDPSAPDYGLFDRAFQVLAERQRETPYWRPLRPFRVTSQGMILLPQSVEIANSLLRICSRLDQDRYQSYFSDHVDLFKSYTAWLESRMFVGRTKRRTVPNIFGWQSEHTFAPGRIHLWQTSQALLYLMHYGTMLQDHIARRSFRAARFSLVSAPTPPAPDMHSWERWERSEPMKSLSSDGSLLVYKRIGESVIRRRATGTRPGKTWTSSLLLYGPPGTGKSTIAKEIAKSLGYPMITITPSDFITAGQEAAEARAKNIFATLMEQAALVVLFDEVDQLLLDRESELYRAQGDIFKLITPGMLTKLNDLTAHKDVVYVVATNYFERIDRAVKRPGRIDERLLVLPPDAGQRTRFLARGPEGKGPILPGWGGLTKEGRRKVVEGTALYSYGELLDLGERLREVDAKAGDLQGQILTHLSEFPSTISVAGYRSRVMTLKDKNEVPNEQGPLEEFVMVVYLAAESKQVRVADHPWVQLVLAKARTLNRVGEHEERVWRTLERAGLAADARDS